ncbi:hypothetical protein GCM10009747_37480 [Agromyces humatus]|uniref:Uncharacterized protein n=2 Tax=Agromyces humatus TaxID=279573 RepID=A0ABN2L1N8_9MICO
MRAEARPPRRKWPWIVSGVVVAALGVAGGIWYSASLPDKPPIVIGSPGPVTPPPRNDDVEPTGCLGGDSRDTAMVLAAQEAAPHTSNGAVEFATSYVRWLTRYPVPSPAEAEAVAAAAVVDSGAYDLVGSLADEPNLSGSLVPNGEEFYVSTVPGVWNLESYAGDTAEISVGVGVVIDGELHPQFRISTMLTLSWEGDAWHVDHANQPRTTEELFSVGTGYTGGC